MLNSLALIDGNLSASGKNIAAPQYVAKIVEMLKQLKPWMQIHLGISTWVLLGLCFVASFALSYWILKPKAALTWLWTFLLAIPLFLVVLGLFFFISLKAVDAGL